MSDTDKDMELASTAGEGELRFLAHHSSPEVLSALLNNKNTTEDIVLVIANRKNVASEILETISNDVRWKGSYRICLALCKNPKTPQRISLSLIKSLRIFDLADLTRNQFIPVSVRMHAESYIIEKIPSIPLGIKVSLAKRVSGNILVKLTEEGTKEVVMVCLDSPYMTEGEIYKIISKKTVAPQVVRMIADHPKWSCRHQIQWALIRNNHAPLSRVVHFLKHIKTNNLKELYDAPEVPSGTKPFIHKELLERGEIDLEKGDIP